MSHVTVEIGGLTLRAELSRPVDLSIPLAFNGGQPSFFEAPPARGEPLRLDGFTGDTRAGGSCNVGSYQLVPHCNGTHTECIGHVVDQPVAIGQGMYETLLPTRLVSIAPARNRNGALSISAASLETALAGQKPGASWPALVIRTLPNSAGKKQRRYSADDPPAFLEAEAAALAATAGIRHLLVDLPSVDPMYDGGRLAAHRRFWGLPEGSRNVSEATRPGATITELIYVPDTTPDGVYLLNLQLPPFIADAAPSRPLIFPVEVT